MVYPRVGGETPGMDGRHGKAHGLSPRGRGNRRIGVRVGHVAGSIPAWAGKPPRRPGADGDRRVYPRVGGETSVVWVEMRDVPGLSPRGRGNRRGAAGSLDRLWSIPAWAGKPRAVGRHALGVRVYPRVGGETHSASVCRAMSDGLSPRGRGNLSQERLARALQRSIPAWAGKPARRRAKRCPS